MKNSSPLTALLFLGVAATVGAAAWWLSGSEADEVAVAPIERPAVQSSEAAFVAVSPKERRKQVNLEAAKRRLKRIKELGEEVAPNLYMLRDSSGDPTYYSTELHKGRGRNGEPLFMTAEIKRVHTAPLYDSLPGPGIQRKRISPNVPKPTLSFGKGKGGSGGDAGVGVTSGGAGSGGNEGSSDPTGGQGAAGGGASSPGAGDG